MDDHIDFLKYQMDKRVNPIHYVQEEADAEKSPGKPRTQMEELRDYLRDKNRSKRPMNVDQELYRDFKYKYGIDSP